MELADAFVRHVREHDLLPAGSCVLVALSGGADSTALLLLLRETADALGLAGVSAAHLDHGLREASADEARAVAAWVRRALGISPIVERREVRRELGESPEEAARRTRYAFLIDAALASGATHVVTAHHADDQAETVLLRILRGTGTTGLRAIPERRALAEGIDLVRPLLSTRAADLRAWLQARGTPWIEDPTNVDGNERARLRHVGLPALAQCTGRDPVPPLVRLTENVAREHAGDVIDALGVGRAFIEGSDDQLLLLPGFGRLPLALRCAVLRDAVPALRGGAGLTHAETDRLAAAVAGDHTETVAGIALERASGGTRLLPEPERAPPPATVDAALPGLTELWDGWIVDTRVAEAGNAPFLERLGRRDGRLEIADADRVEGPLCVRTCRDGDGLRPLGAPAAARLGHVLQRRGVRAADRQRLPLVCDSAGIVWAAGVALADRVRVRPETHRLLLLELRRR